MCSLNPCECVSVACPCFKWLLESVSQDSVPITFAICSCDLTCARQLERLCDSAGSCSSSGKSYFLCPDLSLRWGLKIQLPFCLYRFSTALKRAQSVCREEDLGLIYTLRPCSSCCGVGGAGSFYSEVRRCPCRREGEIHGRAARNRPWRLCR
jgi:hypothetical protein